MASKFLSSSCPASLSFSFVEITEYTPKHHGAAAEKSTLSPQTMVFNCFPFSEQDKYGLISKYNFSPKEIMSGILPLSIASKHSSIVTFLTKTKSPRFCFSNSIATFSKNEVLDALPLSNESTL